MIKSNVSYERIKEEIPFPKLMIGNRTGTIYLALSKKILSTTAFCQIETVVLSPGKNSNLKIGERNLYSSILLEDFHGNLTLSNKID